jgi:hypothetical protein
MQRTQTVNVLGGVAAALLVAAPFMFPFVAGIATWKIILGLIGLWIFVTAGIRR